MTFRKRRTGSADVYAAYAALTKRECAIGRRLDAIDAARAAGIAIDRRWDSRLDSIWNGICDAKLQAEDQVLCAPISKPAHVTVKRAIIIKAASVFDDVSDLWAKLADQIAAAGVPVG